MEGHEPLLPRDLHHHDLRVWLWQDNPAGRFAPTSPTVTGAGYDQARFEEAPGLGPHPEP